CGFKTGNRDDVAGNAFINRGAFKTAEGEHLRDAALFNDLAFAVERVDRLARLDRTRGDTARENAAEERVALDGGHQHAERAFFNGRLRHVLDDLVEKRREALTRT